MPRKIHFNVNHKPACGREGRIADGPFGVTCLACAKQEAYIEAMAKAAADKMERFLAQEPRPITEPWHEGNVPMVCSECGGTLFRVADRTCYGHYQNYTCAGCGHNESRLTETGMSF